MQKKCLHPFLEKLKPAVTPASTIHLWTEDHTCPACSTELEVQFKKSLDLGGKVAWYVFKSDVHEMRIPEKMTTYP